MKSGKLNYLSSISISPTSCFLVFFFFTRNVQLVSGCFQPLELVSNTLLLDVFEAEFDIYCIHDF